MYCPNCGAEAKDGELFCPECGTHISQEDPGARAIGSTAKNFLVRYRIPVAIACAIVVVLAIVGVNASGALTMGQTSDTFKSALLADSIVEDGVASNSFLNNSAYSVTKYSCSDIKKVGDNQVTAKVIATIENENYSTDLTLQADYYDYSTRGTMLEGLGNIKGYDFEKVSSTTTPKKGIDKDSVNSLADCKSVLSDDAKSCTVTQQKGANLWFVDSSIEKTYRYTFDGQQWKYADSDQNDTITYNKAIEGNYAGKADAFTRMSRFAISNLDTAKGTFTIDYTVTPTSSEATTGTITASIEPKSNAQYEQGDDYSYYFAGKGNSSGGNGQSSVTGYFTTSNSGESSIQISTLSIDVTNTALHFNTSVYGTGTLYKG